MIEKVTSPGDSCVKNSASCGNGVTQLSNSADRYSNVRGQTAILVDGLTPEDMAPQSMPDASPTKWHLAHTTWFFETFILQQYAEDFSWFDRDYCHLFNSYYESVGTRHARPQRGLLTRPSADQVMQYRQHVDGEILRLLEAASSTERAQIDELLTIGLHHEMQHQELLQTDLLHLLWHNPTFPAAYTPALPYSSKTTNTIDAPAMLRCEGGLVEVGAESFNLGGTGLNAWCNFSYDCERPRHQVFLSPFNISTALVTNREWLAFMADGGYQQSLLWLSDGWTKAQQEAWDAPLYWIERDNQWYQFGLDGLQALDLDAPVCHVSLYEADAFARWRGMRLPREHEWEWVARDVAIDGNFMEKRQWRPRPVGHEVPDIQNVEQASILSTPKLSVPKQLYGDVWEWTQSAYLAYPGFHPAQGALSEYNGKFMANQFVLRGGSCATAKQQMRASYRNFFYPHHRWQFTGLRLAEDI